jgi:uncharacterized protein YqiB (DUF1249 family)
MQAHVNLKLLKWLTRQPSLGDLASLCEENYVSLMSLIPQLRSLRGTHRSSVLGHQDLLLSVLEQTPYTTLLRLTYEFPESGSTGSDPNALLRVYHDARQVEVEDLRQLTLPLGRLYEAPALHNKWRVNLFVSKWLLFCRRQGHCFLPHRTAVGSPVCDLG